MEVFSEPELAKAGLVAIVVEPHGCLFLVPEEKHPEVGNTARVFNFEFAYENASSGEKKRVHHWREAFALVEKKGREAA